MTADATKRLFSGLASDATRALFSAYGVALEPVSFESFRKNPKLAFIGLAQFAGRGLSGCLVLGASRGPIEQSAPGRQLERDWMAELANQLLGRIKNSALRNGLGFSVVPPAVVSGQHLTPNTDTSDFCPLVFSSASGVVCLWVELETGSAVQLDPELAASDVPYEGDVLFF